MGSSLEQPALATTTKESAKINCLCRICLEPTATDLDATGVMQVAGVMQVEGLMLVMEMRPT